MSSRSGSGGGGGGGGGGSSNADDLRGASAFGSHWRRWRHAILGRSSSAPSTAAILTLGEFVKDTAMKDVLQVRPTAREPRRLSYRH